MLTIETILNLIVPIVGYIFAELSKKFNWVENRYLPLQTIVIGMISAAIYYIVVDQSNFSNAIVIAFSSLIACGFYDLKQTNKEE